MILILIAECSFSQSPESVCFRDSCAGDIIAVVFHKITIFGYFQQPPHRIVGIGKIWSNTGYRFRFANDTSIIVAGANLTPKVWSGSYLIPAHQPKLGWSRFYKGN